MLHGSSGMIVSVTDQPSTPRFLYGTAWKEDRTGTLVEMALRQGFRAVDTANQRRHYFETGVGEGWEAAYRAGIVRREELFLQTKFTYRGGQDHRLPYDPSASLNAQVKQSLESSLRHLRTEYVDSFLLHGPSSGNDWTSHDAEVWEAMIGEREAGRTRLVGVSNVSLRHLQQMMEQHREKPAFVQNRCFAHNGWDYEIRRLCSERGIVYQAFSLLTANVPMLGRPAIAGFAAREGLTVAQVVFAFARAVGMLPLTGTTNPEHMEQDLASLDIELPSDLVHQIERIALAA